METTVLTPQQILEIHVQSLFTHWWYIVSGTDHNQRKPFIPQLAYYPAVYRMLRRCQSRVALLPNHQVAGVQTTARVEFGVQTTSEME